VKETDETKQSGRKVDQSTKRQKEEEKKEDRARDLS
jgi:hypothetical protein